MEIIIIDEIDDKGRDFTFDVQGSTTIDELKNLYFSEIKNLCKSKSRFWVSLFFNGRILSNNESLDSYNIKDGDKIIAREILPGGPPLGNKIYSSNINCMDKRGKVGELYCYKVIGSNEGTVWGNGIYTDDSNIAKAAVLEGKCKIGEYAIVSIKIIEAKSNYDSCSKNGISTSSWGHWDGSYILN